MYIGVVYNFLCDYFFFKLDLSATQIAGVAIVLACTLAAAVYKITT